MKKIFTLAVTILVMLSCSNNNVIKVEDFSSKAENLVDQEVTIVGIAKHICSNSGRKLFLSPIEGGQQLVTVFTNSNMDPFDKTTAGKVYQVNGIVKITNIIDEDYLNEWEQEVIANGLKEGSHICETEQQAAGLDLKDDINENPQMKQIKAYREKIAQNNGKPIVQYHVECNNFEIK